MSKKITKAFDCDSCQCCTCDLCPVSDDNFEYDMLIETIKK
jgi:hypothetical protein